MWHDFGSEGSRSGLWEETRSYPHVGQRHFQLAPKRICCCCSNLSPQQCWWCLCDNIFTKSEKTWCSCCVRKGSVKNVQKAALQTSRWGREEGEEVLQMLEQRLSCSLWRRMQWSSLSSCRPRRTMMEQVNMPWKKLQPMERSPCQEHGTGWKELLHPCWSCSWRAEHHGRDPMMEQGKRTEDGAAEMRCNELTTTPILHWSLPTSNKRVRSEVTITGEWSPCLIFSPIVEEG